MKKILFFIFCISLMLTLALNVSAVKYEYDGLYSVDLPQDFYEVEEYKFIGDKNAAFSVSIEENSEGKSIKDLSEKELKESAELLAKEATVAFKAIGKDGGMTLVSAEKIDHTNGMTAMVTVYNTYIIEDGEKSSHLQKIYEFSGAKNKYTFIYTSYDDKDIDLLDSSFDSINIFEAEAKSTVDKIINTIPLIILLFLFLLGIFKFIRGRKR